MSDQAPDFGHDPHMQETHPYLRPKDAATLILLDRTGPVPKVLMGRRHTRHVFLPGKFVFPGGSVDRADRMIPVASELHPLTAERLMRCVTKPSATKARTLALTAIRETFEETGLLIGRASDVAAQIPHGPWAAFAKAGIAPDLAVLHFVARAVTPPHRPRRYDTRFFAVDISAVTHRIERGAGADAELVELNWVPVAEASQLDLIPITKLVLRDLQEQLDAGFRRDLPVPYYRMLHGKRVRELL
ncbi:MAG TPA: NUDIX hydrolase [Xanthobacteraceae bacterium]|nr:NUDIX hydrolase [Xanthobacteraceae bacterium]